jgi:hypothetical protein
MANGSALITLGIHSHLSSRESQRAGQTLITLAHDTPAIIKPILQMKKQTRSQLQNEVAAHPQPSCWLQEGGMEINPVISWSSGSHLWDLGSLESPVSAKGKEEALEWNRLRVLC